MNLNIAGVQRICEGLGAMARKMRVEFPGAVYHVISRGNYREDLFGQHGSGKRFEETLFEVVERCGWKVLAYVIMRNHYHLALETPEANLVAGMKWLQGVFATRFNRLRKEQGHVFQGRYKAILVGEDRPLLGLVDYIHLNPVRAGICDVDGLRDFALSSYPKYWSRKVPAGLDRGTVLYLLGAPDSQPGMRKYREHLRASEAGDPRQRDKLKTRYCRGWFIGSKEEKKELARRLAEEQPEADWELPGHGELNEARWEAIAAGELRRRRKSEEDLLADKKGAPWKAEIAWRLRRETTAANAWIARRLKMGHPSRVSILIGQARERKNI